MALPSFFVVTPAERCQPELAISAVRAGEAGILDFGFWPSPAERGAAMKRLRANAKPGSCWGVRLDLWGKTPRFARFLESDFAAGGDDGLPLLIVAGMPRNARRTTWQQVLRLARTCATHVLVEVEQLKQAEQAAEVGFDGVLLKGHEAGGRVSKKSAYLFTQHAAAKLRIPFWVQGGIGPDTAAAVFLAGAAGVVLSEQLWLTRESPFDPFERAQFAQLDGSETQCLGDERGFYRFFHRWGKERLHDLDCQLAAGAAWPDVLHAELATEPTADGPSSRASAGISRHQRLLGMGQAIGMAARLADQHVTVAGVLQAYRTTITNNLGLAGRQRALSPGSALAERNGTRFPIVQGPMTRVSDVAPFCEAIAKAGALPFLALALLRGTAVRNLLTTVAERLGDRPWGAGILGFVPPALRKEQLEVVLDVRPKFAIIAGGRPAQARQLEDAGITTYLHVPSPGLLRTFMNDGARRFIFEGRECGGHVGPQSSFSLWQSAIDVLQEVGAGKMHEFELLFAGGIHDRLSAAMVAAAAAGVVENGAKIGVLMGTAYLFTEEAVTGGAITTEFQTQALACQDTALVESGWGHATRCAITPFVDQFAARRRELLLAGASPEEIRAELEMFNIGRLRIASKGIARRSDLPASQASEAPAASSGRNGVATPTADPAADAASGTPERMMEFAAQLTDNPQELITVDAAAQREQGMYMIGEVATLRDRVVLAEELHGDVSQGSEDVLERRSHRTLPWHSERRAPRVHRRADELAIVGLGCMFPQSPNIRAYWQNIVRQSDAIREVPSDRWNVDDFYAQDRTARDRVYSKWGSFLDDTIIDPLKYQIPPASLRSIEPIQLLALEAAEQALLDAGYTRPDFPKRTTSVIFAAAGSHDLGMRYAFRTMARHYLPQVQGLTEAQQQAVLKELEGQLPEWTEDSFAGFLLNVIAGRISNRFDLGGTNYTVDAACASSLAALQAAADQLRRGYIDAALVGAVDGTNNPFCFMCFAKTHALSPHGRSRSFDEKADGIGLGEGIGTLVLKRIEDAERDGDRIHAVIKGIGSSSDGRNRSLTAPFPAGQLSALHRAYEDAGVNPATVTLLEAHSTGTVVGDRVECEALQQLITESGGGPQSCAVGSVKSMLGHTKTAAGIASLLKVVLAMKHRTLPGTIGVETPLARLRQPDSPLYVNTENRPWLAAPEYPRRAGVSSFGFGGTNFHVVLEEYAQGGWEHAQDPVDLNPRSCELFLWQRPSREAMRESITRLSKQLQATTPDSLEQLAYAVYWDETERSFVGGGENASHCRLAIVASSVDDLQQQLTQVIEHELAENSSQVEARLGSPFYREGAAATEDQVCLLFPGQGSQVLNMGRDLVLGCPELATLVEQADRALAEFLPKPLSRYVFPVPVFDESARKGQQEELNDTRVAQPAMALADLLVHQLLRKYGIQGKFAAGHSFGEYVALAAAGMISATDLFRLAAVRGSAVHQAGRDQPGAMAAVSAPIADVVAALPGLDADVRIANVNAPDQVVVAGAIPAIEQAVRELGARGLNARRIPVTAAFHTPALAAAGPPLEDCLRELSFETTSVCVVYSNTTAAPYPNRPDEARALLSRHLTEPVQFVDQVRRLHHDGARVFVEVGPGSVLTNFVRKTLADDEHWTLACAPAGDGWRHWGMLMGRLAALGLPVRMAAWFAGRPFATGGVRELLRRVELQRTRKPTDWVVNSSRAKPWQELKPVPIVSPPSPPAPTTVPPTRASSPESDASKANESKSPATAGRIPQIVGESAVGQATQSSEMTQANGNPIGATDHPVLVSEGRPRAMARPDRSQRTLGGALGAAPQSELSLPRANESPSGRASGARLSSPVLGPSSMISQESATKPASTATPVQPATLQPEMLPTGPILQQFNQVMSQWLELQTQHAVTSQRFLDLQERVLMTCLATPDIAQFALPAGAPNVMQQRLAARPVATLSPTAPRPASPATGAPPIAAAPSAVPTNGPHAVPPVAAPAPRAVAPAATRPVTVSPPAKNGTAAPVAREAAVNQPSSAGGAHEAVTPNVPPAAKPVEVAPMTTTSQTDAPPGTDEFRQDLLDAISARTGYPLDMLKEDALLEADLGIDSIKTVEVFSSLTRYHRFLPGGDSGSEEESLSEFAEMKTLGDIVRMYDRKRSSFLSNGSSESATQTAPSSASSAESVPIQRYATHASAAPLNGDAEKKN